MSFGLLIHEMCIIMSTLQCHGKDAVTLIQHLTRPDTEDTPKSEIAIHIMRL